MEKVFKDFSKDSQLVFTDLYFVGSFTFPSISFLKEFFEMCLAISTI